MRLLVFTLLLFSFAFASAQQAAPASPAEQGQMYQLYLDKPVHKVIKVEYLDGTPIKHDLGEDGETLYLHNYKKGRVKVVTEDEQGKQEEVFRSPCFIDPVIPA